MANETSNAIGECIYLCKKLKTKLKQDAAGIEDSVRGDVQTAYVKAISEAVRRLERVNNSLEEIYSDVVVVENLQGG